MSHEISEIYSYGRHSKGVKRTFYKNDFTGYVFKIK